VSSQDKKTLGKSAYYIFGCRMRINLRLPIMQFLFVTEAIFDEMVDLRGFNDDFEIENSNYLTLCLI